MARIRSVKPSIWGDDRFARLSRDARLTCLGLISNADDAGRFYASPGAILGAVFPHDDLSTTQVRRWRDEIAATGMIELYTFHGQQYGRFPRWKRHQRIDKPQPSALPSPPDADEPSNGSASDSTNGSGNHSTPEGKGKEVTTPPDPPTGGKPCREHKRRRGGCEACRLGVPYVGFGSRPLAAVCALHSTPQPCISCAADKKAGAL
jgi:hypothetical protein